MSIDKLETQLNNWAMVEYRMRDEGMEYCFKHYSTFEEIDDEEFHNLRLKLIEIMEQLDKLVESRIVELRTKIDNHD